MWVLPIRALRLRLRNPNISWFLVSTGHCQVVITETVVHFEVSVDDYLNSSVFYPAENDYYDG